MIETSFQAQNTVRILDENSCLGFNAHPVTYIILFGAMMVVPFYVFGTYVQSKASIQTGLTVAWIWLVFGAGMSTITLFDLSGMLGTAGNLIVLAAWFLPSFMAWLFRTKLVFDHALSQKWLVALQLWRSIGGLFLVEMARGNLAPIFAYAAGIGDLLVALDALIVLIRYRSEDRIPAWAVYQLIVIGSLDFLSALFFGVFSGENDVQLFYHDAAYNPTIFPIGLIPLFLVPYAIFFHTLSFLTQRKFGTARDPLYWEEASAPGDSRSKSLIEKVEDDDDEEEKCSGPEIMEGKISGDDV